MMRPALPIILAIASAAVPPPPAANVLEPPAAGRQDAGTAPPGGEAVTIAVRARAIEPGEVAVLDIGVGPPFVSASAEAFGRSQQVFRVDDWTWRVLVGIDVGVEPGDYPVAIEGTSDTGERFAARHELHVGAREFPKRVLSVDPDFVRPPRELEPRLARERERLSRALAVRTRDPYWTAPFTKPVDAAVTSRFGARSVFNGEPRGVHRGVDIRGRVGTPIVAPNAGRVLLARDHYFSGKTVVIDHGAGVLSFLGHMSRIEVREHALVSLGDPIGAVGQTGRATGPHLHWGTFVNGAAVDPLSILDVLGPTGG